MWSSKRKIAAKLTIHQNSAVSKALLGKFSILNSEIISFLADIGYLVKLLDNHWATLSTKNVENISKFEGWGLTLVAYKKERKLQNKWLVFYMKRNTGLKRVKRLQIWNK